MRLATRPAASLTRARPDYSRRTSRATRSLEKEPISRTLPAENSVLMSVLAVKPTVLRVVPPGDYGCRSVTAFPLLLAARAAVHRE